MTDTSHIAFFGDATHTFKITPQLISELEAKTNAGIGELCKRLFGGQFRFADITETIRLGLIGGGLSPEISHRLVQTYAMDRPLEETLPLAIDILSKLWFGQQPQPEETNADA